MKVIMLKEKDKVMEFIYTKININIAGIGKIIKKVVKEFLNLKKKENMKVILIIIKEMVLVLFIMLMVMFIKVSGKMEKKMVKVLIYLVRINKD